MARKAPADLPSVAARPRFARALEKRVLAFIRRHDLVTAGQRVVVGVSGGPDSTTLLLLLARWQATLGIELAVAHFDHGLRGRNEAREDAKFVSGLARNLGLEVAFGRGEVRQHAQRKGMSLEEAGRELRYAFLAQEAARLGAGAVAVGHTASDQAETVLGHIVRGSGLDGLVGMRPRAAWPLGEGPALVRPLLEVWRAETEGYCQALGVVTRQDPTNILLEATRNRIRHQVLPLLRGLNPAVEEALLRLASAAAGYIDYLDELADILWADWAQEGEGTISFSRPRLAGLAPAMAARLLRRGARRLVGAAGDVEAVHVQAMLEGLGKRRTRLNLPQGLSFLVRGPEVLLTVEGGKRAQPAEPIPPTPLAVPGRTRLLRWTVEARLIPRSRAVRAAGPWEAYLDAEAAGSQLLVRSRRPGDRLRPLGLGGEKKVQDLLVDAKVPLEERDGVPIVCAPWGIVWVVGHRIDEQAVVKAGTGRVIHLRFEAGAGPG